MGAGRQLAEAAMACGQLLAVAEATGAQPAAEAGPCGQLRAAEATDAGQLRGAVAGRQLAAMATSSPARPDVALEQAAMPRRSMAAPAATSEAAEGEAEGEAVGEQLAEPAVKTAVLAGAPRHGSVLAPGWPQGGTDPPGGPLAARWASGQNRRAAAGVEPRAARACGTAGSCGHSRQWHGSGCCQSRGLPAARRARCAAQAAGSRPRTGDPACPVDWR